MWPSWSNASCSSGRTRVRGRWSLRACRSADPDRGAAAGPNCSGTEDGAVASRDLLRHQTDPGSEVAGFHLLGRCRKLRQRPLLTSIAGSSPRLGDGTPVQTGRTQGIEEQIVGVANRRCQRGEHHIFGCPGWRPVVRRWSEIFARHTERQALQNNGRGPGRGTRASGEGSDPRGISSHLSLPAHG